MSTNRKLEEAMVQLAGSDWVHVVYMYGKERQVIAEEIATLRARVSELEGARAILRELSDASDELIMDNDLSGATGIARFAVALTAANRVFDRSPAQAEPQPERTPR